MLFSTIGQGQLFLWMVGAGLIVSALYSLSGAIRQLLCAGFWLTLIVDVFTGLGAALILTAALVFGCYGQFRPFELLGTLAGMALFALGIEPPLKWILERFGRTWKHIWGALRRNRLINVIFR